MNKECDSRTAFLKNGDNAKVASKEKNIRNESRRKEIKSITRKIYARLLVYIAIFIIGFVCAISFGKIISVVFSFPLVENFIEKKMKKYFIIKYEFLTRCVVVLAISSILGGCVLYFNLNENISAAFCALMNPSTVSKIDSYKSPNASPDIHEPKRLETEEQEWLEKQNSKLLEIFNHIVVTQADYECASKIMLSKDISNYIFFLDGQYKIESWDNEEDILLKVSCLTRNKHKEKNKNVFDQEANELEKNEINAISNRQKNKKGKNIPISERLDDTNTRSNFYSTMPKASLALLLANDYHLFALIAFYYGYPDDVIIYYYVKSIEYQLEYISFKEVSDETVKEKLIWISTRYEDIVFTCNDTTEASLAKKLAYAFRCLSSEY